MNHDPSDSGCGDSSHAARLRAAREAEIPEILLSETGDLFKMLSDPTRLRILSALAAGELCVLDLCAVLGMSQSAVSHQLAALRASRLVSSRREGKMIHYSLADEHVGLLLDTALEHASERARPPVRRAAAT